jgi:glycosyltransferase involved in cell wall biosynthesis
MEAMASGLQSSPPRERHPRARAGRRDGSARAARTSDLLADALQRLFADPSVGAELARAARERVIAEFDIRRIGPSIAALFESAPGARLTSSLSR